jgi:uncharacterized membrane protein
MRRSKSRSAFQKKSKISRAALSTPASMASPPVKCDPDRAGALGSFGVFWNAQWTRFVGVVEPWLDTHIEWFVWVIVLAGLYLRIDRASDMYLNSDEQQIMIGAMKNGLIEAIRAAPLPYGPLMNIVLHLMSIFGQAELYLRLPSIIAGALVPFVAYRWAGEMFGKSAGFVTALILAFAPELIILSAQLRHYMIHLFFLVCSLYYLERALKDRSIKWMRIFAVTLLLAVLTLYISAWYVAAAGLYALIRILREKAPWRVVREWMAVQVIVAAILLAAYFSLATSFHGTGPELAARNGWLRGFYYHPEDQTPWKFLTTTTDSLFGYVFANATYGTWMIALFLLGVILVAVWKGEVLKHYWAHSILLVGPLIVTAAAAFLGFYPYGGTRHDAFLAVFIAVAVGVSVSFLTRRRLTTSMVAATFLVPAWLGAAQHHYLDDYPQLSRLEQEKGALSYLSTRSPTPQVVLVDQAGGIFLNYYVCHGVISDWRGIAKDLVSYRCGEYRILELETWIAPLGSFAARLREARQTSGLFPDPAWIFSLGHNPELKIDGLTDGASFGKIDIHRVSPLP